MLVSIQTFVREYVTVGYKNVLQGKQESDLHDGFLSLCIYSRFMQKHNYTHRGKYAWFPSFLLVIPSSSDYALPCNTEMLKMHSQKQKAYYITLVDNNVCTLSKTFRKAAQWQACHFVSVILD